MTPGLRIDWGRKRVEIDCKVVLREGLLETLICSPRTKEHESILVTDVRPLHIYQALGMLGLEPGAPPSYDREKRVSIPARGAKLVIQVRAPQREAVPIESWVWEVNGKRALAAQDWVFAGSVTSEKYGFGADTEGTIMAVVDFPTSLIALPEPHTEANDQLWLSARPENIPPLGTSCTVIIQAEESCVLQLELKDGRLYADGVLLESSKLVSMVQERRRREALTRVDLIASEPLTPESRRDVMQQLLSAGLPDTMIRIVNSRSMPGVGSSTSGSQGQPESYDPVG